jgi:hypothetical protein
VTSPRLDELHRMLDRERERPLGGLRDRSNRVLGPVSEGLHAAGDNLLRKAARALSSGDEDRARRYVERAVDLPFDEHERIGPAWFSASMLLFTAISDQLDVTPEGDNSWLTAAEQVLQRCEPAEPALLGALAAIANNAELSRPNCGDAAVSSGLCRPTPGTSTNPADRQDRLRAIQAVVAATIDCRRQVPAP